MSWPRIIIFFLLFANKTKKKKTNVKTTMAYYPTVNNNGGQNLGQIPQPPQVVKKKKKEASQFWCSYFLFRFIFYFQTHTAQLPLFSGSDMRFYLKQNLFPLVCVFAIIFFSPFFLSLFFLLSHFLSLTCGDGWLLFIRCALIPNSFFLLSHHCYGACLAVSKRTSCKKKKTDFQSLPYNNKPKKKKIQKSDFFFYYCPTHFKKKKKL